MSIANYYCAVGDGYSYSDLSADPVANGDTADTDGTYQAWFNTNGSTFRLQKQRTITTSTANGYQGEICQDSNYIYICVGVNTWKRCALTTW